MKREFIARFRMWVGASRHGLSVTARPRYSRKGFRSLDSLPQEARDFLDCKKLKTQWCSDDFKTIDELAAGIQHGKLLRRSGTSAEVLFDVNVEKPRRPVVELECMKSHLDGSHWGLSDWYSEIEDGIKAALKKGKRYSWTTGWYGSKKEIASAKLTHEQGKILVEVSVSDDFDTNGTGEVEIPHTRDLELIDKAISEAWDRAERDRKANAVYVGFSILRDNRWVETYIKRTWAAVEYGYVRPPGDNYHRWGWQRDGERIRKALRTEMEDWIEQDGRTLKQFGVYTVKPWETDDE